MRTLLLVSVLALLQPTFNEKIPRLDAPSMEELISALGDEAAARALISLAVGDALARRPPGDVFVPGDQIRREWLPVVPHIRFVVLEGPDVDVHVQSCGKYLFIGSATRDGDEATIMVGQGNFCSSSGSEMAYERAASGWRRNPTAPSGGFASGITHCYCPSVAAAQ